MKLIISFAFFTIFFSINLRSQDYPQNYFRNPLDVPIRLSGNFGELRNNHFHAGLDLKTEQRTGLKIYAAAEGYVSRIKVSPYGYGTALYIRHPNGYTTTYGHLSKFSDEIAAYVKKAQYERERFEIELFPEATDLPVYKGQIVAYSGNSGGSAGPHLHFEIRNTANEHPINPLLFGFEIADTREPLIFSLHVYPLNDTSTVNGSHSPLRVNVVGGNGSYVLQSKIEVDGEIGFGIRGVDKMDHSGNTFGNYSIALLVENDTVYKTKMEEFAFHEGRYINSHIDYEYKWNTGRRVEQSFVDEGNKLRIYKKLTNRGHIVFDEEKTYPIQYVVEDAYGNTSKLNFEVHGKPQANPSNTSSTNVSNPKEEVYFFPWDQRNTLMKDNILVDMPAGIMYHDIYFGFKVGDTMPGAFTPTYWLHDYKVPLHSYYTISIKTEGLSPEQKSKALIVSTVNGRNKYAEGGKWNGDNISVRTRSFGGYTVVLDEDPPVIRPINIYNGASMKNKWSIHVRAYDRLSGINYYRGTVDGKWVLMEYDAKNDSFVYFFDERLGEGKHTFHFMVTDEVGNTANYTAEFYR